MSEEVVPAAGMGLMAQLEAAGAITKTSLVLPPDTSFAQFEALFLMTLEARDSMCWWLGDLINFGEKVYGETYAQAVEITGLTVHTLQQYASVCGRIPRSRRRPPRRLSFSTHAAVAYESPGEQERWLKLAEKNGWKRSQLREALSEAKGIAAPDVEILPPAGAFPRENAELGELPDWPEHICQCPACGRYHRTDIDVKGEELA